MLPLTTNVISKYYYLLINSTRFQTVRVYSHTFLGSVRTFIILVYRQLVLALVSTSEVLPQFLAFLKLLALASQRGHYQSECCTYSLIGMVKWQVLSIAAMALDGAFDCSSELPNLYSVIPSSTMSISNQRPALFFLIMYVGINFPADAA